MILRRMQLFAPVTSPDAVRAVGEYAVKICVWHTDASQLFCRGGLQMAGSHVGMLSEWHYKLVRPMHLGPRVCLKPF
jgi:hypothetical protein